jgi:hypothetical protein
MMTEATQSTLTGAIEHVAEPGEQVAITSEQASVFAHPSAVLEAPTLTGSQKRALLAGWASDACALEGRPAWRWLSGTTAPVLVDDILASLQALDREGLH